MDTLRGGNNSSMKFNTIFIAILSIVCSISFAKPVKNDSSQIKQQLPQGFTRLKQIIDTATIFDTSEVNNCLASEYDTSGDSESIKHPKVLATHRIPCTGTYSLISNYASPKILHFKGDDNIKFIAQSSHDRGIIYDLMLIKYPKNLYAYVGEHVCGYAFIYHAKDSISSAEVPLSKTYDDKWHIVQFNQKHVNFITYADFLNILKPEHYGERN